MNLNAEGIASRCLRKMLQPLPLGASIEESGDFDEFQGALELVIPAALANSYDTWRAEGVDGFRFGVARKIGAEEAEFAGLLLLIGDQSWIPLHLRIRLAQNRDEIEWMECKVGESQNDDDGLKRIPYVPNREAKALHSILNRLESIQWAYHLTQGTLSSEP